MKFKIIINYKSVRECYMAINPMIRKILYGFIGTSLAMSIVFYCFHQIQSLPKVHLYELSLLFFPSSFWCHVS